MNEEPSSLSHAYEEKHRIFSDISDAIEFAPRGVLRIYISRRDFRLRTDDMLVQRLSHSEKCGKNIL